MKEYRLARYGCYLSNISMAAIGSLSPLLFVTFREMYGISYTLLGLLVVINFSTQLLIDLIFTFFSQHFNIHKTVRSMPLITGVGLIIYALLPNLLPGYEYLFLAVGTVIMSISAGLSEVLVSPVIAAIPADDPESEMSKLHSIYAWGVVGVVIISTLFLQIFGTENWMYLALMWMIVPVTGSVMFAKAKLPPMKVTDDSGKALTFTRGLILCFLCIFLGGAAECTMTQWVSDYLESAMTIPKLWGDILGMAMFALLLGIGRTAYSKCGKNIVRVMLIGMAGATVCYVVAAVSPSPVIGLIACVVTGLCVSMLWPGSIIYVGEKIPGAGVAIYALMAAGGDMGASVAPQLVGIITDKVGAAEFAASLAAKFGMTAEQIGMRTGMLISAIFPLVGIFVIIIMHRHFKRKNS